MLPLVLHCLSTLSRHRLPSGGTSPCPLLAMPLPLSVPLCFSGALASHLPWLFVVSPLVMPLPPICLCLCLSLCPSCASCLAGCHVASHHADASHPPVPQALVAPLPLVTPLLCLSSTLAVCCVASPHEGALHLPAPLPPRNALQAVGLTLIVKPNCMYDARPATMRRTLSSFGFKLNPLIRWQPWS